MNAGRDRGSSDALGLVLIAPAVIGLAILVIALGRGVDARAQVRSAAEAAAQAAALERDAWSATSAANSVARAMLVDTDTCSAPVISVTYPRAIAPTGDEVALVEVTVRCLVSDRGVEAVQPGDRERVVTAVASLDFFRATGSP
ncbi:MAG TPA: hypothetical protein VIS05_01400 [Ilumatobacter sp.]